MIPYRKLHNAGTFTGSGGEHLGCKWHSIRAIPEILNKRAAKGANSTLAVGYRNSRKGFERFWIADVPVFFLGGIGSFVLFMETVSVGKFTFSSFVGSPGRA